MKAPDGSKRPERGIVTIRRRVAAKLSRMTPEQALVLNGKIQHNDGKGSSMDNATIRELTGGFCSQSLNYWVQRQVAVRAGLLPKVAA